MLFEDLRLSLLTRLRARVHNGELTERGLARHVGVSQPHMHNLLKGNRMLTAEMADRILFQLRLSVLDLVDPRLFDTYSSSEKADPSAYSYLPILRGQLGPSHQWPVSVEERGRFPIPMSSVTRMWHPVVVRLGDDIRMHPLFSDGDLALLDQSQKARVEIDPNALYVVKRGRVGLVRRIKQLGKVVCMLTEDSQDRPAAWERLPVEAMSLPHFVRARATLISREADWPQSPPAASV